MSDCSAREPNKARPLQSWRALFVNNYKMAKRRMFSIDVVGQDNFLDMPTDSRELYFQLGMYADDEGYVSPRKVMRITGAGQDSMKILVEKSFVYLFKSGVIVVTHWHQNNYIQSDRFMATTFKAEKEEWKQLRIQDVYKMDTQGGREVRKEEPALLNVKNYKPKAIK